jgi:P27 family predicted phage terminase small subunit
MRGRKPLAPEVHKAIGSYDHNPNRENRDAPPPLEGAPEKPPYLDAIASQKWDEVIELLSEMRVLSRSDGGLIEAYAVTYAGYRKALENVAKIGQVIVEKTDNGIEAKRSPWSAELHKYMDRMTKLLAEMGLTPSARGRLKAAPIEDENDPITAILKMTAG